MAMNVLHHHDGIVHQYADGKYQRKQGNAIQRETPRPGSKQRCRQGQHHRDTHHQRLASPHRDPYQRDYRQRSKKQFLDKFHSLIVSRFAIVARNTNPHIIRYHGSFELLHPRQQVIGDFHRIRPRLFGNRYRYSGEFTLCLDRLILRRRSCAEPHIAVGLVCAILHLGDIAQEHWLTLGNTHDQLFHLVGITQKIAGLHQQGAIVLHQIPGIPGNIGGLQGGAHILHGKLEGIEAFRIEQYFHHALRTADRSHFSRAGHALQLSLDCMCHLGKCHPAADGLLTPQRQRNNGYIIYALRLDNRLRHAQRLRQPIRIGMHYVI